MLGPSGQAGQESDSHPGIRGYAARGVTWREDFRCPGLGRSRRKPQWPCPKPRARRLPSAVPSAVPQSSDVRPFKSSFIGNAVCI